MTVRMDKEKIAAHFGAEFLRKTLADIDKYADLWRLSAFEQIDYYSVNCIFKCVSEKHGFCILKIGKDSREAENEFHILKEYGDSRFCAVHEADISNGVLLIERIMPGTRLRDVADLDARLGLFREISSGLHKNPADKTLYPTYLGWVSRIARFMKERGDYEILTEKMARAEQICRSLCVKYSRAALLHGDLHHDNILLGHDGWRIIDPKGVVGDPVFDIPRFILNEFDDVLDDAFREKYVHITRTISEKFGIPAHDVRSLTFVEMCMANCWNVESRQKPNMDEVLFTEKMMDECGGGDA